MGHIYAKISFIVYLNSKSNWVFFYVSVLSVCLQNLATRLQGCVPGQESPRHGAPFSLLHPELPTCLLVHTGEKALVPHMNTFRPVTIRTRT